MRLLGLSAFDHDAAAALVVEGVPVAAAAEERFTRRRHDPSFPRRAIRFCLREGGISAGDLDGVAFCEKPLRKFERILVTQLRAFPRAARAFSRSMFLWLGDRLWMKGRIASEIGVDPDRLFFVEHHLSHAASAFFHSPFEEAAILVADGAGEWASTSLSRGQGASVETVAEMHFPHSLGLLYSAITSFLGFEAGDAESRVTALAALGEPRFEPQIAALLRWRDDASFELDLEPFRFHFDPDRLFGEGLARLLGSPRAPGAPLLLEPPDGRDADVAASVQRVLEDALLRLARELHRRVPSENLCFAGGVAENVVATARLAREGPFHGLYVPPAAGESGAALGAALYVHHAVLGGERRGVPPHAFLGEGIAEEAGSGAVRLPGEEAVVEEIVRRLAGRKLVGWVRGRFEWGPRSLGRRTLFADPRRPESRERANRDLKRREAFVPFAPALLAERAGDFVERPAGAEWPLRFGQLAVPATARGASDLAAAVHADGTARAQLVDRATDPILHRLLARFGEETGVPALLATSLRLRGEPIVRGEKDALALFERSGLDALVVEDRLYERG